MKTKLTPAQERVLRELCAPGADARFLTDRKASNYYINGNGKKVTGHVLWLLSSGLAMKGQGYDRLRVFVTPAGRALLAEIDEDKKHDLPCSSQHTGHDIRLLIRGAVSRSVTQEIPARCS